MFDDIEITWKLYSKFDQLYTKYIQHGALIAHNWCDALTSPENDCHTTNSLCNYRWVNPSQMQDGWIDRDYYSLDDNAFGIYQPCFGKPDAEIKKVQTLVLSEGCVIAFDGDFNIDQVKSLLRERDT